MFKKIITFLIFIYFVDASAKISSKKDTNLFQNPHQRPQNINFESNISQNNNQNVKLKTDFGKHNIFLQQNEKYVLTPALLFGSQSSFQIEYKLQITNEGNNQEKQQKQPQPQYEEQVKAQNKNSQKFTNKSQKKIKDFYKVHPALQKISSYDLTLMDGINVADCLIVEIFFQSDEVPFLICERKSKILEVFKVQQTKILYQFSFNISFNGNQMSIISPTQIIFYNASNIHFYSYDKVNKNVTVSQIKLQQNFLIQKCKPYIEDVPNYEVQTDFSDKSQTIDMQSLHLICFTNNNVIARKSMDIQFFSNQSQIKKDFVIVLLLQKAKITQLDHFQLPQRSSSLNHIVGFDVIDCLENVIMICYNLYRFPNQKDNKNSQQELKIGGKNSWGNANTAFISSYCSIFKIYLDSSQMVLINRMMLEQSPYPLLQTSLQINVMLAVATQKTITFYHLDVLKEMFEYIQKISVPDNSSFNCYEFSQLKNSFESVSLSCAKGGQDSKTVSFVMIYDQDLQKYVAVGNLIEGKRFFHSGQLIFALDELDLSLHQANQEYIVFSYIPSETEIKIYEVSLSNPEDRGNFTTLKIFPAQHGQVYVDKSLPLILQTFYDIETYIDLKGSFEGSNISFVKVQVFDEKGDPIHQGKYIDQDKIYSYEYSLLLSIYIKQECIRVIKIDDSSFYRILRIEKSRVDEAQAGNYISDEINEDEDQQTLETQQTEYYYYTETCNKIEGSYVCELSQVHSINSSQSEGYKNKKVLKVESKRLNKVIDIEYLSQSNMFVYLYEWKNPLYFQRSYEKTTPSNYGILFVNMIDNQDQTTLHCYELKFLIQDIYQKVLSSQIQQQRLNISKVEMQKNWLFFEITYEKQSIRVYCLLNNVKTYFFGSQQINSTLHIEKSCLIIHVNQRSSQTKQFIQEDRLIVSQITNQSAKTSRKLTVFNIINNDQIVKQGVYFIKYDSNPLVKPNADRQFIGLYKQYMILVNETTISKYHMGFESQLLYEFVYNPQFLSAQVNDKKFQHDSFAVKYVLFLQKYLIVQFESFYQLYDIGEQLISIQISANNFNTYLQSLSHEDRKKFSRGKLTSSDRIQNVIINDAFLIEGDNIVIYEKDHLVVAKYITNPSLKLGSFEENHLLVQKDLQIKLTPILDFFSDVDEVFQQVMLKIYYSHYVVQKIAKNIKTLTVPSQTENFQLQIWTNVFRGPVIQYYLSDTFDGQIILKQHIQDISNPQSRPNQNQSEFIIVQHHVPYDTKYVIKRNASHLSIQVNDIQSSMNSNTYLEQQYYLALNKQLVSEVFLEFLHQKTQDGEIIFILTEKSVVFIQQSQSNNSYFKKFAILGSVFHNISMQSGTDNIVSSVQIQVLKKDTTKKKENNKETFIITLLGSQNRQKLQKINQNTYPTFIQLFQVQVNLKAQENKILVTKTQQLLIGQEVLQIRSIKNKKPELAVLTYFQTLRFYEITGQNEQSLLKLKQSVNLKDIIPAEFRSDNEKYVKFQIFNQKVEESQQNAKNMTLLLFSQTDRAFHVEFQVYTEAKDNEKDASHYDFLLKNIYTGYPNYKFLSVVKIGFEEKRKKTQNLSTFKDRKEDSNQSNIQQSLSQKQSSYIYFVIMNEFETTSQIYLTYYPFNYNYSINKQVGYFKCGQKISPQQEDGETFRMEQQDNVDNTKIDDSKKKFISHLKDENDKDNEFSTRYLVSLDVNGKLQVQFVNFTQPSMKNPLTQTFPSYDIVLQQNFQINTTIYMILKYQKPPIVSYILLNARNFNVRAGIYTKFIFIQDEGTWYAFYIVFPIVLLLILGCGVMLKKHQPKGLSYMEKSKPSIQEIIYSDESRATKNKEERVICIQSSDEEESSNYRGSMEIEESSRFGYIPPDSYNKNKQSSVLQSPFRSVHGRNSHFPDDIDESDIEQTPKIRLITMQNEHHDDHQEDKEILSYLISKKASFASNTSSFG